jgi:hypothetical protein
MTSTNSDLPNQTEQVALPKKLFQALNDYREHYAHAELPGAPAHRRQRTSGSHDWNYEGKRLREALFLQLDKQLAR